MNDMIKLKELYKEFSKQSFVSLEVMLYKVSFDINRGHGGLYYDNTNNPMRDDMCNYLNGAWRMYKEFNG